MKRGKIILTALTVLVAVSSALAYKVKYFHIGAKYYTLVGQTCTTITCTTFNTSLGSCVATGTTVYTDNGCNTTTSASLYVPGND